MWSISAGTAHVRSHSGAAGALQNGSPVGRSNRTRETCLSRSDGSTPELAVRETRGHEHWQIKGWAVEQTEMEDDPTGCVSPMNVSPFAGRTHESSSGGYQAVQHIAAIWAEHPDYPARAK